MRVDRIGIFLLFLLLAWVSTIGLFSLPVLAAEPIYQYVDDGGTVNYTNRLESVPKHYRSRVQEVDRAKPTPAASGPVAPQSDPPAATTIVSDMSDRRIYRDEPPAAASWFDGLPTVTMPLPSRFHLAVGLSSGVLIIGAVLAHGISRNPLVRLMLKLAITLTVVGTFYAMYFSGLNERITELTRGPMLGPSTGTELGGDTREE